MYVYIMQDLFGQIITCLSVIEHCSRNNMYQNIALHDEVNTIYIDIPVTCCWCLLGGDH